MTLNELINKVYDDLLPRDRQSLKVMAEADLITLHHNFGRHLRNTYGLWENQYSIDSTEPSHPDDVSQHVIEQLWKRLQNV